MCGGSPQAQGPLPSKAQTPPDSVHSCPGPLGPPQQLTGDSTRPIPSAPLAPRPSQGRRDPPQAQAQAQAQRPPPHPVPMATPQLSRERPAGSYAQREGRGAGPRDTGAGIPNGGSGRWGFAAVPFALSWQPPLGRLRGGGGVPGTRALSG